MQKVFLFFIVILCANKVNAQLSPDSLFYCSLTDAIENSSAADLTKLVHNKVDIILLEQTGIYSKNQAKFILDSFFTKNEVKSFSIESEKQIKNSRFFVGKMHTKDKEYRICFLTKNIDKEIFIYQIRIEE